MFQGAQSRKERVKKDLQKIRVLILTSVIMSAIFFCMSWFAASGRLNWYLKILFKWKIRLMSCSFDLCDIRTGDDFNESEFPPYLRCSYFPPGIFEKYTLWSKDDSQGKQLHNARCATTYFDFSFLLFLSLMNTRHNKIIIYQTSLKSFYLKFILTFDRFILTSTQYVTL